MKYKIIKEFLADLRKKFREGDKEIVKIAELKRLEQENKIIKEFIQEFRKKTRENKYERSS